MDEQDRSYPDGEEVARALRRCWQPVARREDLLKGPGRAILLGEPLAVFLTADGAPAVVSDRCPHRGASLSMGKVSGVSIQCPYHGWEWHGSKGACTRIPSLADQTQIPPAARIDAYPARERWGLVWTALDEPLGDPPSLACFEDEQWSWGSGTPFELPVDLGLMIENFRDVAHFAFVHRETLGATPEVVEPLDVELDGTAVTMRRPMRAGGGAEEIWGSIEEIVYRVLAPNFTSGHLLTSSGERCVIHAARAISATESAHYWLAGVTDDYEYDLDEVLASEERLYAEDRPIVSAVRPPCLPLNPNAAVNTLADSFTLAYRRAFCEFVTQALQLPAGGESSSI
jgi:phenylpropionate dioxygenase-like ring-hydroxylating dioxygenase large terminal subunit